MNRTWVDVEQQFGKAVLISSRCRDTSDSRKFH